MRRVVLLALVLLAAGCTRGFVQPGRDFAACYRDYQACAAATDPRWSFCIGGGACLAQGHALRHARAQCMRAKGWTTSRRSDACRP